MSGPAILHRAISTLLGYETRGVILAPGVLVALRLFLHHKGARVILLSDREYYGPEHFPGLDVHVAPFAELAPASKRLHPDAVLASVVSWTGQVADPERLVRDLAVRHQGHRPMVCLDWCQAGAAGFPPARGLDADLILGDATKWLVPAGIRDRLAFAVGREEGVEPLLECFAGLYLSGGYEGRREARWIDPLTLAEVASAITELEADRDRLSGRHAQNMRLARAIAQRNGLDEPESALLWFPGREPGELDLDDLPSQDLVWRIDAGVRVTCQVAP